MTALQLSLVLLWMIALSWVRGLMRQRREKPFSFTTRLFVLQSASAESVSGVRCCE